MNSSPNIFAEYLQGPEAKVVFGIAVVLITTTIFVFIVLKIRDRATSGAPTTGDHLTEFREMYESGTLSEFEYRRVKSELGESIHQQVLSEPRDSKEQSDLNDHR